MTETRLWGATYPIAEENRTDTGIWAAALQLAVRKFRAENPDMVFEEAHEDLVYDPFEGIWYLRVGVTYRDPE